MIGNAVKLDTNSVLDADICIIGGGTAGLVMALDLADSDLDIVVLEAGKVSFSKAHQSSYAGASDDSAHPLPQLYRQRRLGGTSTIWGGRCVPFDPIDFHQRSYVPNSGWPFNRQHLNPFYRRAQEYVQAGAFDYDARTALSRDQAFFIDGLSPDSINIDTASLERFSLPTDMGKSLRPYLASARNVRLLVDATCLKLVTRDGGLNIDRALCRSLSGKTFAVKSKVFVVAVGGLETVRLLSVSNDYYHTGLGNQSDCLGRFYMCHLETAAGEIQVRPSNRKIQYGFQKTNEGVYVHRRFKVPENVQSQRHFLNMIARPFHASVVNPSHLDPVLSAMFLSKRFLIPEYRRKFSMVERASQNSSTNGLRFWAAHLRNVGLGAPQLVRFAARWTQLRHLSRRRVPYVALHSHGGNYPLDINSEQVPNAASRVKLADSRDAYQLPRLKIEWRVTNSDIDSVIQSTYYLRDQFAADGCATLKLDDDFEDRVRDSVPVGGHHIGTARMSMSDKHGVVDADARIYGLNNAYIAGSAIFPTCSHANPTLTLLATSIRLCDYLRNRLGARLKVVAPHDQSAD